MNHAPPAIRADAPAVHEAPPSRLGALRAGLAAMPDTLHAEWTKLRTVSGTGWLLAGVVTATATIGVSRPMKIVGAAAVIRRDSRSRPSSSVPSR